MCGSMEFVFEFVTYICEHYAFLKWEVVPYSAQYCSNSNLFIILFTADVFECVNELLCHSRDMYVVVTFC